MSQPVAQQRGPDPDLFRTTYRRQRWYIDPLPACDIAPATDDRWPSVTTVKKAWQKPYRKKLPDGSATVPLDAFQTAEWVLDNLAAVTALAGDRDAALSLICGAPGRKLKQAADRGAGVHSVLEAAGDGTEVDEALLDPAVKRYLPACRAFLADWSPRFLMAEVVSINRTLGYGGTFDSLAEIDGRRWLVDYKSRAGQHGCYEEEVAQLGGYSLAEYIVLDDGAGAYRAPLPEIDGVMIVSLCPDGTYEATPIDLGLARTAFRALYDCWSRQRSGQKAARDARGPALIPARDAAPQPAEPAPAPKPEPAEPPSPPASPERVQWLRDRVATIYGAGHSADIERLWDVTVCPAPIGEGYTDDQVSQAAAWCDEVEAAHELPFPLADPLFAEAFPGAQAVDPKTDEPVERFDPEADARHWTAKAREVLDEFEPAEVLAIARAAGMSEQDSRMNERRYRSVAAIVSQLGEANGAVQLAYNADGPVVIVAPGAADAMEAACAGPDGKLGRSAALSRAKALAKDLGLPIPRGLAKAAESPLLAALVAEGYGAPINPPSESENI